jgi:hypothetical protein
MRSTLTFALSFAVLLLAMPSATSAPPEGRFPADAGAILAKMGPDAILEMGFRKDGSIDEIEFHVPYDQIPADVRAALDKLLPGGEVLDAEIEYVAGAVLPRYEVTKKVDGMEAEVLVDPKGNVITWELAVAADRVPDAVKKAADGATGGEVTQYEEIRDGAKQLTAYHVKKEENGIRWKIAISPEGAVDYVRREMKSEVEVTVR